jgi:hypothetical protein
MAWTGAWLERTLSIAILSITGMWPLQEVDRLKAVVRVAPAFKFRDIGPTEDPLAMEGHVKKIKLMESPGVRLVEFIQAVPVNCQGSIEA